MKVNLKEKFVNLEVREGDIFQVTSNGYYYMLKATHKNDEYRYSLISLSDSDTFYSGALADSKWEDIKSRIDRLIGNGVFIHFPKDKYEYVLDILKI